MTPPRDDDDSLRRSSRDYDDLVREAARAEAVPIETDLTGALLGNYRVVRRLGRGGMGVVYQATDTRLRREVALKVLLDSFARDGQRRGRFLREARSAASATHANLAAVYDVGESDGRVFIAMELVEGETLRARIQRGLPIAESVRVAKEIARGLGRAHEKGIVHRDLKPENVMITGRGEVKVLDFGLAKHTEEPEATASVVERAETDPAVTNEGRVLGTPAYMSPEQVRGTAVDARTDVFAFGVVLYEMLTGERPFVGETTQDVITSIVRDPAPRPSERHPLVPAALDRVVMRCLDKDRGQRFASAAELLEALEGIEAPSGSAPARFGAGAGTGPSGATVSSSTLAPGSSTRRWVRAAIGVSLLAAAAAGGLGMRARTRRPPSPTPGAPETAVTEGRCTTQASCGHGSLCRLRDGRCVPLETDACKVMADPADVDDDRTIWFGVMLPTTGPRGKVGSLFTRGVDVARRDFAQITHGLPSAAGSGTPRPLAFVSCDDGPGADAPAHHLVEDLEVPAIIGFGTSEELVSLAPSLFIPHDVLSVASVNASLLITSIPHPPGTPRLVFRTSVGAGSTAPATALFVSEWVEPRLRAAGVVSAAAPMRVALIRNGSATNLSISDATFNRLRFNGRSAAENGANFRQLVFAGSSDERAALSADDVVAETLRFRPHVILALWSLHQDLQTATLERIERGWPKSERRPTVVIDEALDDYVLTFIGKDADRRHRYFGVQPPANTVQNVKFTMRYNEVSQEPVTINNGPAGTYDAAYLLAYATIALRGAPITGSSLSRAIASLVPPGVPIDVGPTHILEATEALGQGRHIDLRGANGTLDFDLATGEALSDAVVQCVSIDATGMANDGIDSGLYYEAATNTLRGEMKCP